jgi:hypothetical protein
MRVLAVRPMPKRSRFQRFVESVLPWYDPEEEAARDEHSRHIHEDAIRARQFAEEQTARVTAGGLNAAMREGYRRTGRRMTR